MTQKAAIVSTVRAAPALIDSFVRYHLRAGFVRIYLIFDDPEDPGIAAMRRRAEVEAIPCDERLRAEWQRTRFYALQRCEARSLDINDRQQLNVAVAIERALRDGVDWLLHIDYDELLYAPEFFASPAGCAGDMFQSFLDRGFRNVTFRNFEAVPEFSEIEDPFRQVTLFKRHPAVQPGGWFTPAQSAMVQTVPQFPERFFFNYGNGKSAAAVSPGLIPDGVHEFYLEEQQGLRAQLERRLTLNRLTRRLSARWSAGSALAERILARQTRRCIGVNTPTILHYPNWGFEQFWTKYGHNRHYHAVRDSGILDRMSSFHEEAQRIVQGGDKEAARAFFEERVVISDRSLVARLISSGLLCRIREPSEWLASHPTGL
jgi:hypothetical protein